MTNKLTSLALVAMAFLVPGNLAAQETAPPPPPQQVLERLGEGHIGAISNALAILTQQHERRPRSELDAFADKLVALAIAGYEDIRSSAWVAQRTLIESSSPEEPDALPYAGAYDALHKVFWGTQSDVVLSHMIEIDPRRAGEVVRELLARHGDDACVADKALLRARNGEAIAREFGVEPGPGISAHYCLEKYHDYKYRDALAQIREGKPEGVERAVDILTERASGYPVYISVLANSLMIMAASDGGTSDVAHRALAVFERSARPVHADAISYGYAYETVVTVFEITESQAALESLVEIDAARAHEFLTELAQRDRAVACTARAALAGTAGGPRLLRDLEERGALTYRCRAP